MLPVHPTAIVTRTRWGARGVLTAHSVRHDAALTAIRRVHAASLHAPALPSREGAGQQETPEVGASEVSTTPDLLRTDRRAARAQSDTTC
jgi:hypothetical protein